MFYVSGVFNHVCSVRAVIQRQYPRRGKGICVTVAIQHSSLPNVHVAAAYRNPCPGTNNKIISEAY